MAAHGKTVPKTVRLAPAEVRRAARLRQFFPEATSEADMGRLIFLRGLLVLEAEVASAGGPPPPGQSEAELVGILTPRILAVCALIERYGKLPASWPGRLSASPAPGPEEAIDDTVEDDMQGLAGDFL